MADYPQIDLTAWHPTGQGGNGTTYENPERPDVILKVNKSGLNTFEAVKKEFDVRKIIVMAAFNEKARKVAASMYPTLVFDHECQARFSAFFREILATEKGAVLYHCTQGKDRTGIASALILAALGASSETIVADIQALRHRYCTCRSPNTALRGTTCPF
ncbi:MAG: tyrosine-protein phosphatase [Bacteroidales bacterium]|nr:tyrosine-protein phosphatase [Bacteroidales bacterium]